MRSELRPGVWRVQMRFSAFLWLAGGSHPPRHLGWCPALWQDDLQSYRIEQTRSSCGGALIDGPHPRLQHCHRSSRHSCQR